MPYVTCDHFASLMLKNFNTKKTEHTISRQMSVIMGILFASYLKFMMI
jgi:hypothetical protein